MTDSQYQELVEGFEQYILSGGQNNIGVLSNSWLLHEVANAAGLKTEGLASGWGVDVLLEILDSLTYNGVWADKKDDRKFYTSMFKRMREDARSSAGCCQYGDINVGGNSCMIVTPTACYHGLNIHAPYGLGVCSERVALMRALSARNGGVTHLLTVNQDGEIVVPCGVCLEFMERMGLRDTWVAVDYMQWLPMRKVREYVDIHRARD